MGGSIRESGEAADRNFGSSEAGGEVLPCRQKTWIGISLVDRLCRPVEGEPYRVTLPGGEVRSGVTGADGVISITEIDPGSCVVSFPGLDRDAWRNDCDCPDRPKDKTPPFIEFVLEDMAGQPASGERFRITHPDGMVHDGKLDAAGSARYDGCPAGNYKIAFPDLDSECWVSANA